MAKPTRKRRVKRISNLVLLLIHATFNNTIVMITDVHGNAFAWSSAGALGFKVLVNLHHSLLKWLQAAAKSAQEHGLKSVEVTVKGPGFGRVSYSCLPPLVLK